MVKPPADITGAIKHAKSARPNSFVITLVMTFPFGFCCLNRVTYSLVLSTEYKKLVTNIQANFLKDFLDVWVL